MTIEFLKKITIGGELKRKRGWQDMTTSACSWRKRTRFWEEVKFRNGATKDVVIIGVRTLSNGWTEWDAETGNIYTPETYFKALLVVERLNSKPFFILPPKDTK